MRVFWLLLLIPALGWSGEVRQHHDEQTGLLSWEARHPAFTLQLVQMLPDYVSAVYSSRGLPPALIDGVLKFCVFGTILTNASDDRVSYRVADWRYVTPDGERHPVRTKSEWLAEWAAMGVPYRWSMLPDEQTFEPGDWSQGFTTIALSPDSGFDFLYSWTHKGETHEGIIEDVRCAPAQAPAR